MAAWSGGKIIEFPEATVWLEKSSAEKGVFLAEHSPDIATQWV